MALVKNANKQMHLMIEKSLFYIGSYLYNLEIYEMALLVFRKILNHNAHNTDARYKLGRTLLKLQDNPGAVEAFKNALQERPESCPILTMLGTAYLRCGDTECAENAFRRSLDLNPEDVDTCQRLAQTLRRKGKLGDAMAYAKRAANIQPLASSYIELGRIFLALKDFNAAAQTLSRALELEPRNPEANFQLAKLYRNTGDYSKSKDFAQKAVANSKKTSAYADFSKIVAGELKVYRGEFQPSCSTLAEYIPSDGKILHILENSLPYRTSGYTYRSNYILKTQKSYGLLPIGITRPGFPADYGKSGFQEKDVVNGVTYHRIGIEGSPNYNHQPLDHYLQHYADHVLQLAREEKPSLLHAHSNFKNGLVAKSVAQALGIPWVYELRGLWEDTQVSTGTITSASEKYNFFRGLEDVCLKSADAVITISHMLKKALCERGIASDRIYVVPNAVDVESFPVVKRDVRLSNELKIGDAPTIGYITSLVQYEGVNVLIHAFKELIGEVPKLRLVLVGDGEERKNLEDLVEVLEIGEHVIITGRIDHSEILRYYSLIDIFVVPRLPLKVCELVTPLKPYEAMSTGRVLVVSDLKALREMVIEDRTGLFFNAGDPAHLAQVCLRILFDQKRQNSLRKEAAQWVRKNRTWQSVVRNSLTAYQAILNSTC